jgi:two-component system phosphate regulon sensor histidine kinase PhoR
VNRLNNLINSILYISGLEQRKTVHKYPHDYHIYQADSIIRELVNETAVQLQIPKKSIKFTGQTSCKCVIDRNWLGIVFANLLDNAIKYSKEPVEIRVTIHSEQKYFIVEISDKGIGISPNDQKKIFSKFERIYSPDIPNVKGTGLGLYWVKEIIKYHGGKISIKSAGPGLGSTFRIELPVYQASRKRYIKNLLKRSKKETDNPNE